MAFRGRVTLVTGAGSGLGREATRRLAAAGAQVAALDVNEEWLRETARDAGSVRTWCLDVTDRAGVERAVAEVETKLGPIDRVVNAAAIMPTGFIADQDAGLLQRVMEINYGGTVNVTMAALPRLLARGSGDIINFASMAGWVPTLHFGAYAASKFAVVAFTEVLYHENRKRGLRVVCVCPSKVDTPLLDQAKSRPRILEAGPPPMAPGRVLDAIETALERGAPFVFPGWHTAIGWRLRRFVPWLMWAIDHRTERV